MIKKLLYTLLLMVICGVTTCCAGPKSIKVPVKAMVPNAYIPNEPFTGTFTQHAVAPNAKRTLVPIIIEQTFSEEDKSKILSAVSELNVVFNQYAIFMIVADPVFLERNNGIAIRQREIDDDNTLAYTDHIGGHIITVDSRKIHLLKDEDQYTMIMLHELCHCLNMSHLQIRGTLMYPTIEYQSSCFDETSARQLATAIPTLLVQNLNWCTDPN